MFDKVDDIVYEPVKLMCDALRQPLKQIDAHNEKSKAEHQQALEQQMKELKGYIEEVFADYNDINDDTRMQLELINQTLAELQAKKKLEEKPRRRIGFIQHDE